MKYTIILAALSAITMAKSLLNIQVSEESLIRSGRSHGAHQEVWAMNGVIVNCDARDRHGQHEHEITEECCSGLGHFRGSEVNLD
jgi:hypothetical protein